MQMAVAHMQVINFQGSDHHGTIARVRAGLQAAHQEGIVHRDISPRNLLVTRFGEVKIGDFGVSNFDRGDMEDAARLDNGLTGSNQVLYCLSRRGPEFDLLPWMRKRSIPLMAYSPLDQGGLLRKAPLKKLADEVGCTPAQLALAWLFAQRGVVTIPKSSNRERVKENFAALQVKLTPEILHELDRAFPPPRTKQPLEML